MNNKTARRAGILAGFALIPALAFGVAANAATPGNQAPASQPASVQQVQPAQKDQHVRLDGKIVKIETGEDNGQQIKVITLAGEPGGKEIKFIVTPRTVIDQQAPADGLKEGDLVRVEGTYDTDHHIGTAEHVTVK